MKPSVQLFKKLLLLTLFSGALSHQSFSQNLKGKIVANNGNALAGATVQIKCTSAKSIVNDEGAFSITPVKPLTKTTI